MGEVPMLPKFVVNGFRTNVSWGHNFSCVRPFHERAGSNLDRSMHRSRFGSRSLTAHSFKGHTWLKIQPLITLLGSLSGIYLYIYVYGPNHKHKINRILMFWLILRIVNYFWCSIGGTRSSLILLAKWMGCPNPLNSLWVIS